MKAIPFTLAKKLQEDYQYLVKSKAGFGDHKYFDIVILESNYDVNEIIKLLQDGKVHEAKAISITTGNENKLYRVYCILEKDNLAYFNKFEMPTIFIAYFSDFADKYPAAVES